MIIVSSGWQNDAYESFNVILEKGGIQRLGRSISAENLDSGFRRNDGKWTERWSRPWISLAVAS